MQMQHQGIYESTHTYTHTVLYLLLVIFSVCKKQGNTSANMNKHDRFWHLHLMITSPSCRVLLHFRFEWSELSYYRWPGMWNGTEAFKQTLFWDQSEATTPATLWGCMAPKKQLKWWFYLVQQQHEKNDTHTSVGICFQVWLDLSLTNKPNPRFREELIHETYASCMKLLCSARAPPW